MPSTGAPSSGSALASLPRWLLIHQAGFVIAGTVLFVLVARGFGSTRLLRDLLIGLALTLLVFVFFVKFLNVGLPPGWLRPILGGAGI